MSVVGDVEGAGRHGCLSQGGVRCPEPRPQQQLWGEPGRPQGGGTESHSESGAPVTFRTPQEG